MIDEPQIVQTNAIRTAFIHITCPREQIQQVMGPGYLELFGNLKAQGLTPSGPWFTHHLRMDPSIFDFEICLPVDAPVTPSGRVQTGELAPRTAARTVYHGGYDGLSDAWAQFDAWIKKHGHKTAVDLWEVYLAGPEAGPDASNYRTELNRPLQ